MDVLAAILFNSLTLGPLALSSFATPAPPCAIVRHLPAEGVVTSTFGSRHHPLLRLPRHHDGVDIANTHATIIYAAAPGRVTQVSRNSGYGLMIDIDHGLGWHSRYAHLANVRARRGDYVFAGAIIGKMGDSGLTTGTHLHFELRHKGQPVNPVPFIVAAVSAVSRTETANASGIVRH